NSELFNQFVQSGAAYLQLRRRPAEVPAVFRQGALDQISLQSLASLGEPPPFVSCVRRGQLQSLRGHLPAFRHDHGPMDPVLQLAHVPWPSVRFQSRNGFGAEGKHSLQLNGLTPQEGAREQRNVSVSL